MAAEAVRQNACVVQVRARSLARVRALVLPIFLGFSTPCLSQSAPDDTPQSLSIATRPITRFRIGSDEMHFGPLEFSGGLEMTSGDRDFGSLSSFRFIEPGGRFIGVADTGFWFFGSIAHDEAARPAGISDFTMMPMAVPEGYGGDRKWVTDAESIALRGERIVVGFERLHRISEFRLEPNWMDAQKHPPEKMLGAVADLDFLIPVHELRDNQGFETIDFSPQGGALSGALVAVTERSIDEKGNFFAAILDGPEAGVFTVVRHGEFDITDGAFLPDGDLLLLERSFSVTKGVAMRLRRIEAETIRRGGVADGPVLLEADMAYQIDNMEALDVWQRDDGATMISLMSDDNHSLLQRNLYLEFRLVEE